MHSITPSSIAIEDQSAAVAKVKELLAQLPICNRIILKYLLQFLMRVSSKADINKMTPSNISIVFSPNLLKPLESRDSLLSLGDANQRNAVVELFILAGNEIWKVSNLKVSLIPLLQRNVLVS